MNDFPSSLQATSHAEGKMGVAILAGSKEGEDLSKFQPIQLPPKPERTKTTCAPTRPFKLEASDVGYSTDHGDSHIDLSVGTFCFRVESDSRLRLSAKDIEGFFIGKNGIFCNPFDRPQFIQCPTCTFTFNQYSAFLQHMVAKETFGLCQPEISLTNRKFFGASAFFIPKFVLDFIAKVASDGILGIGKFYLDVNREVTKIPALGVHDKDAEGRAEQEKIDMKSYVEDKIDFSMLVGNIADRFLEVLKSKHVPPLFFMSPFFAFMPYFKPLWQLPDIAGVSKEVKIKLTALGKEMQASIKSEASKVS